MEVEGQECVTESSRRVHLRHWCKSTVAAGAPSPMQVRQGRSAWTGSQIGPTPKGGCLRRPLLRREPSACRSDRAIRLRRVGRPLSAAGCVGRPVLPVGPWRSTGDRRGVGARAGSARTGIRAPRAFRRPWWTGVVSLARIWAAREPRHRSERWQARPRNVRVRRSRRPSRSKRSGRRSSRRNNKSAGLAGSGANTAPRAVMEARGTPR
jgi:hypothetical protein